MTPKQIKNAKARLQQRINKIAHKHEKELTKIYGNMDNYNRLAKSRCN